MFLPRGSVLAFAVLLSVLLGIGCQSPERRSVSLPTPEVVYDLPGKSETPHVVSYEKKEFGPEAAEKRLGRERIRTKAIPGAQLPINFGASANDATGDTLRSFAGKTQTNFAELYANLTIVSNLVGSGSAANKVSTNAGTAFGLTLQGVTTNAPSLSAKALGVNGDGATDDATLLFTAITNAAARGAVVDLMGATYGISGVLTLDRPVTIRNGTIKQLATYTNSGGMVSVTSSNVVLERVNIDGASLSLRGLRLNPGVTGFRFIGGTIANFAQPSGLGVSAAAVTITGGTESYFGGGWMVSNVVAVANGIVGDDAGCSRAFYIVQAGSEGPPRFTIEDGTVAQVTSTGSSLNEDADGFGVHDFGVGVQVPGVIRRVYNDDVRKRWVKLMGEGVTVEDLSGRSTADGTNWTVNAFVSVYASHSKVRGIKAPMSAFGFIVDAANNSNPIYDVSISDCSIVGTNGYMLASAEGIRVGGALGVHDVRIWGNNLGSEWAKFLQGIHIAGGVTNYSVIGNTVWVSEHGILDGYRYSGEQTWSTNSYGIYAGNTIQGTPTGGSIRYRKTINVTPGNNSTLAAYPVTFDNGYTSTVLGGQQWAQTLNAGSLTNALAVHIGDSASTTFFTEVPDLQIASSLGTNALALIRFWDGSANRMLALRASSDGVSLDSYYSTGGNGTMTFRMGGTVVGQFSAAGVFDAPLGLTVAGTSVRDAGVLTSGSLAIARIAAGSITKDKIENVAASKLLGRGSASGAGAPVEITIGSGLDLTGQTLTATATGGGGGGSALGPTQLTYSGGTNVSISIGTNTAQEVHFYLLATNNFYLTCATNYAVPGQKMVVTVVQDSTGNRQGTIDTNGVAPFRPSDQVTGLFWTTNSLLADTFVAQAATNGAGAVRWILRSESTGVDVQ